MVAGHLLPPLIDGFLAQRPGLRLTIVQAGAEEIGARVLRGDLDVGIVADWRTPDGLVTELLETQPMVACVAAQSPLAQRRRLGWAELLDQRLIMFPRGYHQRSRVEDAAARLRRGLDIAIEAESLPLIVELVRRGRGVATLLAAAAAGLPGVASLALPREATVPVALCRRADGPPNAAVEAFRAYVLRAARGRAAQPAAGRARRR
jgi:DNA-binding transcriptional LysR family regulator